MKKVVSVEISVENVIYWRGKSLLPRDGRSTLSAYYPVPSFNCHQSHLPSYSFPESIFLTL